MILTGLVQQRNPQEGKCAAVVLFMAKRFVVNAICLNRQPNNQNLLWHKCNEKRLCSNQALTKHVFFRQFCSIFALRCVCELEK